MQRAAIERSRATLFYTENPVADPEAPLVCYRAQFVAGQLQDIVRCDREGGGEGDVVYGLASFRWYPPVDLVDQNRAAYIASFEAEQGSPVDPELTAGFEKLFQR